MHFSAFSNTFVFLHNFMRIFLVFPRPLQRLTVHLLYVNLFKSSQEMHSSFRKCVPNSTFCTAIFSPAPSSIPAKQLDGNYGVFHAVPIRTVSTQGLFTRAAVSKQRPAPAIPVLRGSGFHSSKLPGAPPRWWICIHRRSPPETADRYN